MINTKMPLILKLSIAGIVILFGLVTYTAWDFNRKVFEVSNKIDTIGQKVREMDSLDRIEYERLNYLPGGNISGDTLKSAVNDSTINWNSLKLRHGFIHKENPRDDTLWIGNGHRIIFDENAPEGFYQQRLKTIKGVPIWMTE
jgi:hypothetical protein